MKLNDGNSVIIKLSTPDDRWDFKHVKWKSSCRGLNNTICAHGKKIKQESETELKVHRDQKPHLAESGNGSGAFFGLISVLA